MMRMISLALFTFLALACTLRREKRKRDSSTAQADRFAGAKRGKKSACFARNDSGWGGGMFRERRRPTNCYTENRGSDDGNSETEAGSRGGGLEASAGPREDAGSEPAFHGGKER